MDDIVTAAIPTRPGRRSAAPGPRPRGFSGNLNQFKADRVGFLMNALQEHGDVIRFRFGPRTIHLFQNPDHVQHVLKDDYRTFGKASRGFSKLKMLLGEGLLTSDGSLWQRQRRMSQPAFHHHRLMGIAATMSEVALETRDRWRAHAGGDRPLDVYPEMIRVTLEIVVRTLLGADLPASGFKTVKEGLEVAIDHMNHNIYSLFDLPAAVPTRRRRRFREAVREMDQVVYEIIASRRRGGGSGDDLLSMLMAARDETTGEGMEDLQLRDEVMTFLLAGHETTAIALTWAWYLLAMHPEAARRVRGELDRVLGGRAPGSEDLRALRHTSQVVHETLRLYPPLWAVSRIVRRDTTVGGFEVPAGSVVFISPYATHRHPEFWTDPEAFDPERFPPGVPPVHPRSKFAYIPFGGGPRNCIGSHFATMEMLIVISVLAQAFHLELAPGYSRELSPILTLRPRHGMPMRIRPRQPVAVAAEAPDLWLTGTS